VDTVTAFRGQRERRNIVDLLTIHKTILTLGAALWASVSRAVGFTLEGVVNWIRRSPRLNPTSNAPPAASELNIGRRRRLSGFESVPSV